MASYRVTTTNENWQGKNDPAERRRIQNRLNQRAYRERQKAGETSAQNACHLPSPSKTNQGDEDDKDESGSEKESSSDDSDSEDEDEDDDDATSQTASSPNLMPRQLAVAGSATPTIQPWDELAQLINRNFFQAVARNAQYLCLDQNAIRTGGSTSTPRSANNTTLPPALAPIELQHSFPHDPLIDTLPHARFRFNILRAIAKDQLDGQRFCTSLRRSGALLPIQGETRRSGLIVWAQPELLASWELSEGFVMLWGRLLLEGCEDVIAATNVWRAKRGERGFPITLAKASG